MLGKVESESFIKICENLEKELYILLPIYNDNCAQSIYESIAKVFKKAAILEASLSRKIFTILYENKEFILSFDKTIDKTTKQPFILEIASLYPLLWRYIVGIYIKNKGKIDVKSSREMLLAIGFSYLENFNIIKLMITRGANIADIDHLLLKLPIQAHYLKPLLNKNLNISFPSLMFYASLNRFRDYIKYFNIVNPEKTEQAAYMFLLHHFETHKKLGVELDYPVNDYIGHPLQEMTQDFNCYFEQMHNNGKLSASISFIMENNSPMTPILNIFFTAVCVNFFSYNLDPINILEDIEIASHDVFEILTTNMPLIDIKFQEETWQDAFTKELSRYELDITSDEELEKSLVRVDREIPYIKVICKHLSMDEVKDSMSKLATDIIGQFESKVKANYRTQQINTKAFRDFLANRQAEIKIALINFIEKHPHTHTNENIQRMHGYFLNQNMTVFTPEAIKARCENFHTQSQLSTLPKMRTGI